MNSPSDRSLPLRTCVGCRRRFGQDALVRCVLGADGVARVSRHAAGRGAWLCGAGCLPEAIKRKGFERAWRVAVRSDQLQRLRAELGGN
jgi:predicted RNA-binding protein YlxR (DUF448 family)